MTYSIQADGMYSLAVHSLLHAGEPGYVHSVFQNGWNIRMGDGLIFIGTTKNGRLPFGIHLEDRQVAELIPLIKKDETVRYDIDMSSLLFSSFSIKLDPQQTCHFDIGPKTDRPEALIRLLDTFAAELLIHGQPTGVDISIDHFIECYTRQPHVSCTESERMVIQLMEAAQSGNLSLIDETLRYWIGRGEGLTPSGDDMLAGMLAVDAITGIFTEPFRMHLSELVKKEALTTDISREYLKYALEYNFSSVVTAVLNALLQKNTDNLNKRTHELLRVGHSSGLDTAFGILIGMLLLRRNSNWHKKL